MSPERQLQNRITMTIEERAKDYIANCNTTPLNKMGRLQGYIAGSTEQRKIDIDKTFEYLHHILPKWFEKRNTPTNEFVEEFRKAMEEKQ